MITKVCPGCGKEYLARQNSRKFCSKQCKYDSESGEKNKNFKGGEFEPRNCKNCGREFQARRRANDNVFCSKSCQNSGSNNPQYKGKVKLNCKVCGKEFEAFPAEIEYGRKFCSTECAYSENGRNLKRVEQVKCVCKVCCKEFTVPPSAIKKGNGIVCSRECLIKWKTTEKEVSCKGCGTKFMRQDSHIPKYKVNYCSSECWYRYGLPETQKEMTDIEVKMKDELDKRGIEYEMQQWVEGICCADFLLPGKVIIMCDGDYWHRLPMRPQRDGKQNFRLRAKGYKVFRFWGTDINRSIEECIDTLIGCMGW